MSDRLTRLRALRDEVTREINKLERRYGRHASPEDDCRRVIEEAAWQHGITASDILSTSRARHIVRARQEVAWELRQLNLSYPQIGGLLGRDHSTILRSVRVAERNSLRGAA